MKNSDEMISVEDRYMLHDGSVEQFILPQNIAVSFPHGPILDEAVI